MEHDPELHHLARRWLGREAGDNRDTPALVEALSRLWTRLSAQLTPLIGPLGFRALAVRALREARSEFPFLAGVAVGPEAEVPLVGVQEAIHGQDPERVAEGLAALLAWILALLVGLLGADLTHRLLRAAWPGVGGNHGCSVSGK